MRAMKNKTQLFYKVRNDYGKYIHYCTNRFYIKTHKVLDAIYDADDIEQLIYIHIWQYIGRYNKHKSSLKTYVVNLMHTIFKRVIYLSKMQKRCKDNVISFDKAYMNAKGETFTLHDILPEKTKKSISAGLEYKYYKGILNGIQQRIYIMRNEGYTYAEIGKVFNITRQRVEQIVKKQIRRKIKHYEYCGLFKKN